MEKNIEENIKELFLTKAQLYMREYVSDKFLEEMSLESYRDIITQRLLFGIKAYVWSREVHEEIIDHITYPENWKESLKERFLPSFLKKKYPVKYHRETVKIHHNHMCPHFNLDGLHKHIAFMSMDEPYEYPEIKPQKSIIKQMDEILNQCYIDNRKPIRWKINPRYYDLLNDEMFSISNVHGMMKDFRNIPIEIDMSAFDIHLIEE